MKNKLKNACFGIIFEIAQNVSVTCYDRSQRIVDNWIINTC